MRKSHARKGCGTVEMFVIVALCVCVFNARLSVDEWSTRFRWTRRNMRCEIDMEGECSWHIGDQRLIGMSAFFPENIKTFWRMTCLESEK